MPGREWAGQRRHLPVTRERGHRWALSPPRWACCPLPCSALLVHSRHGACRTVSACPSADSTPKQRPGERSLPPLGPSPQHPHAPAEQPPPHSARLLGTPPLLPNLPQLQVPTPRPRRKGRSTSGPRPSWSPLPLQGQALCPAASVCPHPSALRDQQRGCSLHEASGTTRCPHPRLPRGRSSAL